MHNGKTAYVERSREARIGARIRAARMLAGLSQEKIGDLLGITFQQVQKYEKGANRVSFSRLLDIATFTKQPINFFIPEEEGFEDAVPLPVDLDIAAAMRLAGLAPKISRRLLAVADAIAGRE